MVGTIAMTKKTEAQASGQRTARHRSKDRPTLSFLMGTKEADEPLATEDEKWEEQEENSHE